MPTTLFRFTLIATAIFLGGWLGLKMIVPPGYASPLWPPTGIALAALLLWGKRYWPALLIGAIGNELLAGFQINGAINGAVLVSTGVIAVGFTLQALTACWLSERFLGRGLPRLDGIKQTLLFFVLTGPLACLIAASLGVWSIVAVGILPPSQASEAWLNWWIGDSLGVTVISPLVLCLCAKPRQLWAKRLVTVSLPLLATLLALAVIFLQVYSAEKARIQMAFDSQALALDRLLTGIANNALVGTLSVSDLFKASNKVSRHQFGIFTQSLREKHPEIQAVEWLPRIPYAMLDKFEQAVRDEGYSNFRVTERDSDGKLRPAGKREEYFPITFIAPMRGNERAFGYDSIDNPFSLEAKMLAKTLGKPTASQRMTLIQSEDTAYAVLLSVPIYDNSFETINPQLDGFVSSVILPARLVEMAMQELDNKAFSLRLEDLSAPAKVTELYNKPSSDRLNSSYGLIPWQHEFQFCDRTWKITMDADNAFLAHHGSSLPMLTLVGGLCFSSLLSIFLLTISGRTAQIEKLIEARTAELKASEKHVRESETHLRTLVESQPECIKLLDHNGRLLQMNRAGLDMIEAESLQQVQGLQFSTLLLPAYRPAFNAMQEQVFAGESITLEFEINSLKGRLRWLDTHSVPMRDSEGKIIALLGLNRDITERKRAEDGLKLAARVFGEAHEGILITDAEGNIIDVNPTFTDITGYGRDEVIGKNPRLLQSDKHNQEFYRDMWQQLLANRHWQGEIWNRKKNGEFFAELLTISGLCDEQGQIIYYVGLFSDITHSKQQQHMLELLAHYDPLTSLPNRTLYADRLLQSIARSKRDNTLLAICFLDLDGFKPVNDQFGHNAGDQILIEVAERIRNSLREEDTVSRHGGDEFALLLSKLQSVEQCEQAISRIHQAINEPYYIDDETIIIGVSSGITIYPLDMADPDTLLRHADQAMYQAKLAGKNRYHLFDAGQDQEAMSRNKQARDIEAAMQDSQFCLYYQPKVNLKTGRVTGAEALIRWLHPQQGMIPPLKFLPVIAGSELEIQLGNWVIAEAWEQVGIWHRQGLQLEVSVNISAYHLLWSGFFTKLEATLAGSLQIPSHFLQLEILESTALDDLAAVNRVVKACRDGLGVRTALDDFGTGYSSLNHLRHLPVDSVKIDQSFVRDMLDDPDDCSIVESVISLSQAFRREVVAEGVESAEQGSVLLMMGCYLAQGYAIAKPMPGSDIAAWVNNYRPYPIWTVYANTELNTEQTNIAIRRIDAEHWLERVRLCLASAPDIKPVWPGMDVKNCYFGRWLKRANLHQQYNRHWLAQINELHAEMFRHGNDIKQMFLNGEVEAARSGFEELQAQQQKLDRCLCDYA